MRKLLYKITANLPCRLINIGDEPYLERYFLGKILGVTFYLHRFVSADTEREVHDHPWGWAFALVLAGGYWEERLIHFDMETGWASRYRKIRCGQINIIGAPIFHRIGNAHLETYTLFVHGARIKSWGFLSFFQGNRLEKSVTKYHQPYDVKKSSGWEKTVLKGRDVNRVDFGYQKPQKNGQ